MTTSQKKGALAALSMFAVPLLAAVAAVGAARQQLAGMEPSAAHALDIRDVRSDMREQRLRDSVRMDAMFTRITDVACDQNPQRRYCR